MKKELPRIIVFFLIVVGLVFWTLNYLFLGSAPKSKAAGEKVTYTFSPASARKDSGDFTTTIRIKPSVNMTVRGYQFNITFDKSKVLFKSIQYKLGTVSAGVGDDNSKKTAINQNGKIGVVGEVQAATGQVISASQNTDVVTIVFTANSSQPSSVVTGLTDAKVYMIRTDLTLFDVPSAAQVKFSLNGATGTNTPTPTKIPTFKCKTPCGDFDTTCKNYPGHPNSKRRTCTFSATGTLTCEKIGTVYYNYQACAAATNTPTPTGGTNKVNAVLKLKLKFQGISKSPPAALNKLKVKIKLYDENTEKEVDAQSVDFTVDDKGIWDGSVTFKDILTTHKYVLFVKGPYHIQKKVCEEKPTETAGGTYHCVKGKIALVKGNNNLDLSGITLLSGDLPDQDGTVSAVDTSLIRNNLGKTDEASVENSDINRDGIVDTQDYSLVIGSLSIKNDEE